MRLVDMVEVHTDIRPMVELGWVTALGVPESVDWMPLCVAPVL